MQDNNISPSAKVILNANLDKTNVVEFNDFTNIASDTLSDIISIIKPLCGPNALHDLVIYEHMASEFVSNVFSNDGIHILKTVEHMSPLQDYIAGYIKYIADRVDRASSDGTSTAIYISACLIKELLTLVAKYHNDKYTQVNIHEIAKSFNSMIKVLLEDLESCKIDLSTVDTATRNDLIYKLAHTTSKGDIELSQFAVEIFKDLPEELYGSTLYKRVNVETDYKYLVEYPAHDAVINVSTSNTTKYNKALGTELLYENADLLVIPTYIYDITHILTYLKTRSDDMLDELETENLLYTSLNKELLEIHASIDNIDESEEPDEIDRLNTLAKDINDTHITTSHNIQVLKDKINTKLCILHNGLNDSDTVALESAIDPNNTVICRYVVYHPAFQNNPTELSAILAMASRPLNDQKTVDDIAESIISNVTCHIKSKELMISNLFELGDDTKLHPNYVSKKHNGYNRLVEDLSARLLNFKRVHQQQCDVQEIKDFTRIYRMMVCSKVPILTVGGNTTEHLANINVVDDVMGVVSVAMRYGVVFDIIPKLATACTQLSKVSTDIPYMFTSILNDFTNLTYGTCINDVPVGKYNYVYANEIYIRDKYDTHVNVVQSYKSIEEMLIRLDETIPKLIMTDRIIVPNSIMNKNAEDK